MRPDVDELADRQPRGVEAVHERLHEAHSCGIAGGDHALGLGRGHGQRLLAQDVLAGPGRRHRPLRVEVVRQRDVDGVDVGIGEQCLVRSVDPGDAVTFGHRACPGLVA